MGLGNFSGKYFRKVVQASVPESVETAQTLLETDLNSSKLQ